jgi:hypothetical protein
MCNRMLWNNIKKLMFNRTIRRRLGTSIWITAKKSAAIFAYCYKPEGCRFGTWWDEWSSSIYLSLPGTLGSGVYSASNGSQYHKQKEKCFWGVDHGQRIRLTTKPPSVSQMSRQCEILNISQSCCSPWPVTRITFYYENGITAKTLLQYLCIALTAVATIFIGQNVQ